MGIVWGKDMLLDNLTVMGCWRTRMRWEQVHTCPPFQASIGWECCAVRGSMGALICAAGGARGSIGCGTDAGAGTPPYAGA